MDDGKFVYSQIKSVTFIKPLLTEDWTVFSNPSTLGGVFIKSTNMEAHEINISLTDLTGKKINSFVITNKVGTDQHFIAFNELSAGFYLLQVNDGKTLKSIKLMLQNKE